MALVAVAEHAGEFEKIIELSERCYFLLTFLLCFVLSYCAQVGLEFMDSSNLPALLFQMFELRCKVINLMSDL
jgi:hypothetical protein